MDTNNVVTALCRRGLGDDGVCASTERGGYNDLCRFVSIRG
jgi:hypothetical protein